jgi:hypothetical protein
MLDRQTNVWSKRDTNERLTQVSRNSEFILIKKSFEELLNTYFQVTASENRANMLRLFELKYDQSENALQ